jgi:hypothetical protein
VENVLLLPVNWEDMRWYLPARTPADAVQRMVG